MIKVIAEKTNRYRIQLLADEYETYTHKEIIQILERKQKEIQKEISELLGNGFKPKQIIIH